MEKVVNINALRKLKKLDEFLIDELNMEMQEKAFMTVEDMVAGYKKCLLDDEFKSDKERLQEEMRLFTKFIGRDLYTTLCIDHTHGGVWGMGNVIVDIDMNFVDFVWMI